MQVPYRRGLLLGRGRLRRGGRGDRLGGHGHLTHGPIVQAARDPSQLRQLQNTEALAKVALGEEGHRPDGYYALGLVGPESPPGDQV